MLELALTRAKFFDHLNYRLFIFGSHCRTINFILRRRFIFLFFEKAVRILNLREYSSPFGLQSWCTGTNLLKEANFSPHQSRQLLELALTSANFIDHLEFILFIFGSHSRNQDEFTGSFILSRKFIFLCIEKAVRILSLCDYSWPLGLQPWCTSVSILF